MSSVLDMLAEEERDPDFDLYQAVGERAGREGWRTLLSEALEVLADISQRDRWHSAMCIAYWGSSHFADLPQPAMAIAARLYWCLAQPPGFDSGGLDDTANLVWSTVITLRGVRYESDWDPERDPEVLKYLAEMG